jgi:hypothetical protein
VKGGKDDDEMLRAKQEKAGTVNEACVRHGNSEKESQYCFFFKRGERKWVIDLNFGEFYREIREERQGRGARPRCPSIYSVREG